MVTGITLALAFLCCPEIWAADTVQPLNIKPGLWENTTTREMSGQMPIPPEMREAMAKMPPEQRAKVEEMMKGSAYKPDATPTIHKSCLKKEDLDNPYKQFDDVAESCTRTVLSTSTSKQEMRLVCTVDGKKQTINFHIEVMNSENFKGSSQINASDGTRTMSMNSTFSAKWIGPVCDSKDQKH